MVLVASCLLFSHPVAHNRWVQPVHEFNGLTRYVLATGPRLHLWNLDATLFGCLHIQMQHTGVWLPPCSTNNCYICLSLLGVVSLPYHRTLVTNQNRVVLTYILDCIGCMLTTSRLLTILSGASTLHLTTKPGVHPCHKRHVHKPC
jgi:hypothetical protein